MLRLYRLPHAFDSMSWLHRHLNRQKCLNSSQRWALALSAQITVIDEWDAERLEPLSGFSHCYWQHLLFDRWKIASRDELLLRLDQLENLEDHPHLPQILGYDPLAWHLIRCLGVARWGYGARYITAAETWERILPQAARLGERYTSWSSLAGDYLIAHDLCTGESDPTLVAVTEALLSPFNRRSPWNQIPWVTRAAQAVTGASH